jgi:transcriptional regulator with XRE-family HTH domain
MAAVDSLRSILAVSESDIAQLAGISRNTLASWRSGRRSPYPSTIRRLLEVEGVVQAATALLGPADARSLLQSSSRGSNFVDVLSTPTGLSAIADDLRQRIFARDRPSDLHTIDAEVHDDDTTEVYLPDAFSGPIPDDRDVD